MDGRAPLYTPSDLDKDLDAIQLAVLFRGLKHYINMEVNQIQMNAFPLYSP